MEKVQYGPGSAVFPAGEGRATLVVNNNLVVVSWVAYRTLAPGGQRNLVEMAGAYSEKTATAVDPPLLDWQISCPGPAFTRVYPYTSTASELDLYEQTKSTTLVSRYVL